MDPKGKGKVTDEKEKEVLSDNTPKGAETVKSGSGKNKKGEKKNKGIKKIMYYNSDTSSSSPKDNNDFKKKTDKQSYSMTSFNYSRIPYGSNAHLLSIPLGKPPHFDGKTIHGGVIRCVVIYFHSTLAFGT
jgi:AAA15 family ATPase/GTPase